MGSLGVDLRFGLIHPFAGLPGGVALFTSQPRMPQKSSSLKETESERIEKERLSYHT